MPQQRTHRLPGGIALPIRLQQAEITPKTPVYKRHFFDLRKAINRKRIVCGLDGYPWTDPSIIEGHTPVRKDHIIEMREAIRDIFLIDSTVYDLPARPLPSSFLNGDFDDPNLGNVNDGFLPIRAKHINQLREATDQASCRGDGNCDELFENFKNSPQDCR